MKEIGSFIELQFKTGCEYYNELKAKGEKNIIRLNTGKAALYHAIRCCEVNKVYLPKYQCESVRNFLLKKGICIFYYDIDKNFNPILDTNEKDSAIVLVNYYGIFSGGGSGEHFNSLIKRYNNIIIDNAQAFFAAPIEGCYNVYSPRKFVGAPDGAYVIGKNANRFIDEYSMDYSSDTAGFLLLRIEYGCEGKAYEERKLNEERINNSDIKRMSKLTQVILDGIDYEYIMQVRRENFYIARELFDPINKINIQGLSDAACVPMVYPLLIENEEILPELQRNKIFQGHWWEYLVNETSYNSMENWLSRYILPITIDQRYSEKDIEYQYNLIKKFLN